MITDDSVEIVYESIARFLKPGVSWVAVNAAIADSLESLRDSLEGSASREAQFGLELLYLLGFSRSRELRFRAAVLIAAIGRSEKNLSEIAREHGFTRAAASKAARKVLRQVPAFRCRIGSRGVSPSY